MRTHACVAALIAAAVLALAAPFALAQDEPAPLTVRGDNTVILDNSVYAGTFLQHYLIKCVAKDPQAKRFRIDAKPRPDRSQAAVFPLFRTQGQLPQGKIVLAVGYGPYLTKEDRARIAQKAGTVMVQRRGNVIIIAGSKKTGPWGDRCPGPGPWFPLCDGLNLRRRPLFAHAANTR